MDKKTWRYRHTEEIGEPLPNGGFKWHPLKIREFHLTEIQAKMQMSFTKDFEEKTKKEMFTNTGAVNGNG